jgi:hypothetical protein
LVFYQVFARAPTSKPLRGSVGSSSFQRGSSSGQFQIADENDEYVVVAVSNRDPGVVASIRVARKGYLATLVPEDQMKYRPRGLK